MFDRRVTPRPPITAARVALVIGGSFLLGLVALLAR